MSESVVGSKEVAIAVITFVLANIVQYAAVQFPLSPEQIYGAGVAVLAIVRIFMTDGKITTLLPSKKDEPPKV
jgi:hypothetical protein